MGILLALLLLVLTAPASAQTCGGPGQTPCPSPPIAVPSPQPISISPLVISVGVPACVLANPPCFTVDVKLVPSDISAANTRALDHAPLAPPIPLASPPRKCGEPGAPPCS